MTDNKNNPNHKKAEIIEDLVEMSKQFIFDEEVLISYHKDKNKLYIKSNYSDRQKIKKQLKKGDLELIVNENNKNYKIIINEKCKVRKNKHANYFLENTAIVKRPGDNLILFYIKETNYSKLSKMNTVEQIDHFKDSEYNDNLFI